MKHRQIRDQFFDTIRYKLNDEFRSQIDPLTYIDLQISISNVNLYVWAETAYTLKKNKNEIP